MLLNFARRLVVATLTGVLIAACAANRPNASAAPSTALHSMEQTSLQRAIAGMSRTDPQQSGMRLLALGNEALGLRMALADAAERTLDLQYYRIHDDRAAHAVLAHVAAAAERGVRVRILLDDVDALGRDEPLSAFASHPNVQVRVFNPFVLRGRFGLGHVLEFLGDSDRLGRRMHNKLFVADNAAAIVGGRNLGNEYFAVDADDAFVDLDLFVAGPVVRDLSSSFDEFWNSRWAVPIASLDWRLPRPVAVLFREFEQAHEQLHNSGYEDGLRQGNFDKLDMPAWPHLEWGTVTAIHDRPAKLVTPIDAPDTHIGPRIRELVQSAKHEVLLISPYFVPGAEGVRLLTDLARAGIRVRALTNSLASNDVLAAHAGYARYRVLLLAGGVELYEMNPGGHHPETHAPRLHASDSQPIRLHTKAIIIDRRWLFVGSMNLDPRSNHLNTENGLLVDNRRLAEDQAATFDRLIESHISFTVRIVDARLIWSGRQQGAAVRFSTDPYATLGQRLAAELLSLIVDEELL
jgi:putative cardiolipin synthase